MPPADLNKRPVLFKQAGLFGFRVELTQGYVKNTRPLQADGCFMIQPGRNRVRF